MVIGYCEFCEDEVLKERPHAFWEEGWAENRTGGGTHALIDGKRDQGRVVHVRCALGRAKERKRGIHPAQGTLG